MFGFLLFAILSTTAVADIVDSDVSADKNMALIEEKIKDNKVEFDKLIEEAKQIYKDFDWNGFEELPDDTQRIVIKNYLANKAFSEVREKFKEDIYKRAKGEVSTEDHLYDTYYFNSSDALYRTNYVEDNIMKEAERQNLLHPTEGADWSHFKQQDLPALDKIIATEIAKSPADMYCDKWCIHPRNQVDQDWAQKYLANWKKRLDEYEKAMMERAKEYDEWLNENKKKYKKDTNILELYKNYERQHNVEKEQFEAEMIEKRKEYDDAVINLTQKIDIWELGPYRKDCEMVSLSCWNVEHIPTKYERFQLSMSKTDDNTSDIIYVYDDIEKKEHIESFAFKSCDCVNNNSDNDTYFTTSITCNCGLSFYDAVTDFDKYRRYENLDREDIKNGKLQDVDDGGRYQHEWAGNSIPVGKIFGRTLDIFGSDDITITPKEK